MELWELKMAMHEMNEKKKSWNRINSADSREWNVWRCESMLNAMWIFPFFCGYTSDKVLCLKCGIEWWSWGVLRLLATRSSPDLIERGWGLYRLWECTIACSLRYYKLSESQTIFMVENEEEDLEDLGKISFHLRRHKRHSSLPKPANSNFTLKSSNQSYDNRIINVFQIVWRVCRWFIWSTTNNWVQWRRIQAKWSLKVGRPACSMRSLKEDKLET